MTEAVTNRQLPAIQVTNEAAACLFCAAVYRYLHPAA